MHTKDAGMRIRVERALRDDFVAACQSQGLVAAEVLRRFMRSFADKHRSEQAALFEPLREQNREPGREPTRQRSTGDDA